MVPHVIAVRGRRSQVASGRKPGRGRMSARIRRQAAVAAAEVGERSTPSTSSRKQRVLGARRGPRGGRRPRGGTQAQAGRAAAGAPAGGRRARVPCGSACSTRRSAAEAAVDQGTCKGSNRGAPVAPAILPRHAPRDARHCASLLRWASVGQGRGHAQAAVGPRRRRGAWPSGSEGDGRPRLGRAACHSCSLARGGGHVPDDDPAVACRQLARDWPVGPKARASGERSLRGRSSDLASRSVHPLLEPPQTGPGCRHPAKASTGPPR